MKTWTFYPILVGCLACSAVDNTSNQFSAGGSTNSSSTGSQVSGSTGTGGTLGFGGMSGTVGSGGAPVDTIVKTLPPGFTATDIGGFKLGPPPGSAVPDAGGSNNTNCGNILVAVVRDFRGRNEPQGSPDFEGPLYGNDVTKNLVTATIGADDKPVYASMCEEGNAPQSPTCPFGPETTTKANFEEWYNDTPNVNSPFLVELWLAPQAGGLFTFQSLFFFPLDNAGFGNSGNGADNKSHNFSFTTELHTQFEYNGGETFTFQGDDDVWVYVNGHLAVDLGGLHPPEMGSIVLDSSAQSLGLAKGSTYPLDLFQAERHTPGSTFRIDTNLSFVNCGAGMIK